MKRILDQMENTNAKYKHNRTLDMERLNRLEDNLSLIQSSKISIHSHQPPPPPSFQALNIKVDFPLFNGTYVLQWIFKVEPFFNYYTSPK